MLWSDLVLRKEPLAIQMEPKSSHICKDLLIANFFLKDRAGAAALPA